MKVDLDEENNLGKQLAGNRRNYFGVALDLAREIENLQHPIEFLFFFFLFVLQLLVFVALWNDPFCFPFDLIGLDFGCRFTRR